MGDSYRYALKRRKGSNRPAVGEGRPEGAQEEVEKSAAIREGARKKAAAQGRLW